MSSAVRERYRALLKKALQRSPFRRRPVYRAGKFKPGVFFHEEDKITEIILKDCFTRWCPLARNTGHFVDLGYDQEDNLVGIRIWGDVREGNRPSRSICEGAELLEKLYPNRSPTQ